jgi:lysophospholipase L1-like esterase
MILGFLTAAVCLLILEGGVRVDDWRRSGRLVEAQEIAVLQENPFGTGSYRLRPNLDLVIRVGTTEPRIKTNAHGMNWRETPLKGEQGRARVAFLGDSFTFGSWASDSAHSFVGVFESHLGELDGGATRFEALNFGVGGYGLLDEELLLRETVLGFEPAYVVVVTYTGNDFRDTWLGLQRERIVNGTARLNDDTLKARVPPEQLVEDPTVALDCPAKPWRRLARLSAAFERLAPLFQLVLDAISRMDEQLGAKNIRLAVVALPTSDQVYAQESSGPGFDISLPQSAVGEFCRDRRIPYLDLLPGLRQEAAMSGRRLYLKNDIHLNDHGHLRVGQLIADWFRSRVQR